MTRVTWVTRVIGMTGVTRVTWLTRVTGVTRVKNMKRESDPYSKTMKK